MISRLPKWVWYAGASLALVAGMINAVGFLSFQHQGVTHMTGTTTLFGIALAQGNAEQALHLLIVALAFLAGCIVSGMIVKDSTLKLERSYGLALILEGALLFCAIPLLERTNLIGAYLASCACGVQNGMVSTYSGAVLRTTHVSGIFTDVGVLLGQRVRGIAVDQRRITLGLLLLGGFLLGAMAGAWGFAWFSYRTLYFPATATGLVGILYVWIRRKLEAQR